MSQIGKAIFRAEDCVKLTAWDLPWRGRLALDGGDGRRLGVVVTPEAASVLWRGSGWRIARARVRLGPGSALWLVCPACGSKTWRLFLPPGAGEFACRRCHSLAYGYWYWPGSRRVPKTPRAWVSWLLRKAGKVLAKGGSASAEEEEE